jgi:hypothetical protein
MANEFGNVEKMVVTYMATVREVEISFHPADKHKTGEVFSVYLKLIVL